MLSVHSWSKLLFFGFLLASCSNEKQEPAKIEPKIAHPQVPIPVSVTKDTANSAIRANALYREFPLTGARSLSDLSNELGPAKMFILLKINRRDLKHLKEGEIISVPNADDSEMTYSPFPLHVVRLEAIVPTPASA